MVCLHAELSNSEVFYKGTKQLKGKSFIKNLVSNFLAIYMETIREELQHRRTKF